MKKTKTQFQSIDEYITIFPENIQLILQELRRTIKESAPDAKEAISYQMPTFKFNGNLVHFAAYKNHIGFYPTPSAIIEFEKELSQYEDGKGSVKFPIDKPIPFELIKEIVKFRLRESIERK